MKYLLRFNSHDEYSEETISVRPCVIWDGEHIHMFDKSASPIALFILTTEGITNISRSEDIYTFNDINLSSSDITEDGYIPYIIFPESTKDFSVIVSIDNVETYKLSSDLFYEINDDLLDSLGGEDSLLYPYKGNDIAVPKTKEYGFIYNGVSYWRTGSSASIREDESSETMIHIYNYKSDDSVNMWITNNYNTEKPENGTECETVMYNYTSGDSYAGTGTTITVTTTSKF